MMVMYMKDTFSLLCINPCGRLLELIFLESSSRVFTQADKILDLSKHRAWSHNSKISQLIRKIDRGDR